MNNEKPVYRPLRVEDGQHFVPLEGNKRTKRVHYVLADGHQSYVDIPHDRYTPEVVNAAIMDDAEKHFAVMDLKGPMIQVPQK